MVRQVVIDGQKYQVDQQNVLGSGGEATVVRVNGLAVKIYHRPDPQRIEKLRDLVVVSPKLPKNVCAPKHLVYDSSGRKVLGFAMQCIPSGHEVVQMLSSKKYRRANPRFSSQFVTDLFLADYEITEQLHAAGVIIGDNNDLNKMFSTQNPVPVFIDVDSFQFGQHPCMVGTEAYLDPMLYNLDLAAKCYFTTNNDWYSFWAMYIKSLIMVHPYGGVHNEYRNIPQRALHRVTIFDSNVKYPKAGLNVDILSDDLKSMTERIFANGDRLKPPMGLLQEYRNSLITCGSCGTWYPGERNNCPQCSKINTQQIQRRVNVVKAPGTRTVHAQLLLMTDGNFVWFKRYGSKLCAIAREQRIGGVGPPVVYSLQIREGHQVTGMDLIGANGANPRFDMFGGRYVVINEDQLNNKITIYDTQGKLQKIDEKVCDEFHGRRMFACSKDHLLRLQNGFLYRGHIHPTLGAYIETQIMSFMKDQTWFVASPLDTSIFGFQRFFNNMQFFLMRFDRKNSGEQFTVNLPALDHNESILSVSVRFAETSVLFLMKTEIQGKTYTRVFVIHLDDGRLISHYRVEALPSDTHRNIHGKAFAKPSGTNGIILHPTDDGIVQEVIGQDRIEKQTLLAETEQFVADGDSVMQYQQGLLVIGDKTVNYLTIS